MNVNPSEGALLRHRDQTDRQRDMDILALMINTGPLVFTIHIP